MSKLGSMDRFDYMVLNSDVSVLLSNFFLGCGWPCIPPSFYEECVLLGVQDTANRDYARWGSGSRVIA